MCLTRVMKPYCVPHNVSFVLNQSNYCSYYSFKIDFFYAGGLVCVLLIKINLLINKVSEEMHIFWFSACNRRSNNWQENLSEWSIGREANVP